jgi:phosphoribosyl 1,2-cyclic phosphodiesterase
LQDTTEWQEELPTFCSATFDTRTRTEILVPQFNMFRWITTIFSHGHSSIFLFSHRWAVLASACTVSIGFAAGFSFSGTRSSIPGALEFPDDAADFSRIDISRGKTDVIRVLKGWYEQLSKVSRFHSAADTQCETNHTIKSTQEDDQIIFLGSGSSTGCPRPLCPLLFSKSTGRNDHSFFESPESTSLLQTLRQHCRTSILASLGHPVDNKDYRNNPSLLISVLDKATNVRKNVIIDVGKTFREGALRWLPRNNIRSVDAIVLTHEHMDAAGGLDDVRGFQLFVYDQQSRASHQQPMPLFLSNICLPRLQDQFPWLLPKPIVGKETSATKDSEGPAIVRHVASFDVNVFRPFHPFSPVPGLSITPLPVMHGEDLVSFGFAFTIGGRLNVVYLSDISRMLPETLSFIQTQLPQPIHVLVLDALLVEGTNPVHFCLPQSLELIQQLQPLQTYLVGMNCDAFGPHEEVNEKLRHAYGNVQLAHDGLIIDVRAKSSS